MNHLTAADSQGFDIAKKFEKNWIYANSTAVALRHASPVSSSSISK
jgi:hypothetical protein